MLPGLKDVGVVSMRSFTTEDLPGHGQRLCPSRHILCGLVLAFENGREFVVPLDHHLLEELTGQGVPTRCTSPDEPSPDCPGCLHCDPATLPDS